jgi:RND family efflux transporter MFP subunit
MRPDTSRILLCGALLLLSACVTGEKQIVPLAEIQSEPFEVRIPAFGELKAAKTTPIETPPTLRGIQRIAWIAPDGTVVKQDELVARLDSDQIDERLERLRNKLRKLDFQLDAKKQELAKEQAEIESQLELLAQENSDAEATQPRDERLFPRQEIIKAEINLELIKTKIKHFETQRERAAEKEKTELEIMRLQRSTEQVQIDQLESARRQLEIRAPHEGFFIRGRTWSGETMRIGMQLWPGQSLGELPELSEMEAQVWVLESEAAGLAEGLETSVSLDAHPGEKIPGKIKTIEPMANPIEEDSPVKYFEIVISLEHTDPEIMKPASQVQVTILVTREEEALAVPNQAIFVEDGEPWIYVVNGGGFDKRKVELGQRSVSRTVITAGLEPGESIALVDPDVAERESG